VEPPAPEMPMVMKLPLAGRRGGDDGSTPGPDDIFFRANTELAARLETLGVGASRSPRPALRAVDKAADPAAPKSISIIIPVYNEARNIPPLVQRLFAVLDGLARPFEVIAVNDGSTDRSIDALREAATARAEFKVVNLARNYGQTAAMVAALDFASGDIIVPIDADLQNDPADIPVLLAKLDEGYDVVSGWRKDRKDDAIKKNLVSRIANSLISWISGVRLHDYGCSLKAYRRSVIEGVRLYGEMHRFVPIYASWYGARIAEVPVRHHPRAHGTSNYGLERILKVLLDLVVVRFLDRYLGKPIYVFGGFGLLWLAASFVTLIYVFYLKLFDNISMILTPLPMLVATSFMMGIMSILIGILAEIVVRIYFESQSKLIYHTRETVNLDPPPRT
jgi:glycosyltransferase involved in cell wall biosynthesis